MNKSIKIMLWSLIVLVLLTASGVFIFIGYNSFLKKAYPIKYKSIVIENSQKYGVDQALIYSVIRTESGFDENSVSSAGAIGLMQIMPKTFNWLQMKMEISETMDESYLFEPEINIKFGTYLLSILSERYSDKEVILSAYNAGIGAVDGWLSDPDNSDDGRTLINIPYGQTKDYVGKVIKGEKIYNRLYFDRPVLEPLSE